MDEGMLNGKLAMTTFVNLISSDPDVAKVFLVMGTCKVASNCSNNTN